MVWSGIYLNRDIDFTDETIKTPKFGVHSNLSLVLPSLNVGFVSKYNLLEVILINNIFVTKSENSLSMIHGAE